MPAAQHLHPLDMAIVVAYLIAITLFGLRFRKKGGEKSTLSQYFLADRAVPWWAIMFSIVSAETSTLTIISIPGVAFAGNFGFLQLVIGYMIGRLIVSLLFLPRYFEGNLYTAYQLIDKRFGPALHKTTAALFLFLRSAAEGVRVFAISIVVSIAIGTGDVLSITIISLLTLLYTFEGGMSAVIWTDVVQMIIYILGTMVAALSLGSHVPGGWAHINEVAAAAGKFHIFNFAFNLTTTYTFWAGAIGGTFLTMASHGTEQLMVQRLLAARNLRQSQLALISSSVIILVMFTLFLFVGAGLFVYYGMHAGAHFKTNDYIFPTFIVQEMPTGIAGLLVAAILAAAMSNLSAAINSLSSTSVVDFYLTLKPKATDHQRNIVSKASTIVWAFVLFAVAVYCVHTGGKGHVVETGLSIASVAYGGMLGVFLLGTLTEYASQTGTIIGMVCGFTVNLLLWLPTIIPGFQRIGSFAIPHVAYTWYVLIGALVTFFIGSIFSFVFRRPRTAATAAALLLVAAIAMPAHAQTSKKKSSTTSKKAIASLDSKKAAAKETAGYTTGPSFSQITTLVENALAAHQLPGAVVVVLHGGKTVFEQAYGHRSLEPTLEPMTQDTIFDMASLTKDLATATSIMQLVEQGKIKVDAPVATYLPGFEANGKGGITVRELLTHTSGLAPDLSLKDSWGLVTPDKDEAVRRIMNSEPTTPHGTKFVYSDINFETLGLMVEHISGQPLDVYAQEHIYKPLHMDHTRFLPMGKACGRTADPLAPAGSVQSQAMIACDPQQGWDRYQLLPMIAPTQYDDQGDATTNPNFGKMIRGVVHDPTARRMGGVAGHAGLFSTAHDVAIYAQALLDQLAGRPSDFPVKSATLQQMVAAEQPATVQPATIFNADGTTTQGTPVRGFGWDINTAYSRPRGNIFPLTSFGHTGFTGTSLWMDPGSNTAIIILANSVHPKGGPNISPLRGQIATSAAQSLELYGTRPPAGNPSYLCSDTGPNCQPKPDAAPVAKPTTGPAADGPEPEQKVRRGPTAPHREETPSTLTGIDTLEKTHYRALAEAAKRHEGHFNVGVLTNQSGYDRTGKRTIDLIATEAPKYVPGLKLTALFSPEHGIFGHYDSTEIGPEVDPTTKLSVTSLYGVGSAARHPHHEHLANLDAIVIDLQDVGVHFYTYETAMAYILEASGIEQRDFHHDLEIFLLDRPNPIGGVAVQGPIIDKGHESYTGYTNLPIRHGMTMGELAQYDNGEATLPNADNKPGDGPKGLHAHLTVVPMENWTRAQYYDSTGLPWINPSPNLQSLNATILYPGTALLEASTMSLGRGSNAPFEQFGAGTTPAVAATAKAPAKPAIGQWFHSKEVADYLNARHIPGVTFNTTTFSVADDSWHYPYHGQTIDGVHINLTDRDALDAPELGIEIVMALHHFYAANFDDTKGMRLFANQETLTAIQANEDPRKIADHWQVGLAAFNQTRAKYLIYK